MPNMGQSSPNQPYMASVRRTPPSGVPAGFCQWQKLEDEERDIITPWGFKPTAGLFTYLEGLDHLPYPRFNPVSKTDDQSHSGDLFVERQPGGWIIQDVIGVLVRYEVPCLRAELCCQYKYSLRKSLKPSSSDVPLYVVLMGPWRSPAEVCKGGDGTGSYFGAHPTPNGASVRSHRNHRRWQEQRLGLPWGMDALCTPVAQAASQAQWEESGMLQISTVGIDLPPPMRRASVGTVNPLQYRPVIQAVGAEVAEVSGIVIIGSFEPSHSLMQD
ncbi:hypothetical protein FB45DRAFT_869582 [Roridomyces roridus]|uniref:Uncharacterized protein n=1 Tax=Roridomyces roridus TaxID=1738132 RepID=A0AAD7BLG5_9AGAR|nr:hypothetical protein FB45DRAFT_869582 [Roridomyces roridus]